MLPPLRRTLLLFKIWAIKSDIRRVISQICREKFWVDWYGAYYIHPKHLVFWVCVQSDRMKEELEKDKHLMTRLRNLLAVHKYPEDARDHVWIGFESQETVDRESEGNWFFHFK
jgi:hypothetical protein